MAVAVVGVLYRRVICTVRQNKDHIPLPRRSLSPFKTCRKEDTRARRDKGVNAELASSLRLSTGLSIGK